MVVGARHATGLEHAMELERSGSEGSGLERSRLHLESGREFKAGPRTGEDRADVIVWVADRQDDERLQPSYDATLLACHHG